MHVLPSLLALVALPTLLVAQQCPLTLRDPKPQGLRCGGKLVPERNRGNLDGPKTTVSNQQACAVACSGSATCKSFNYTPSNKACQKYTKTGKKMGLKDSTGGTKFFNIACYSRPTPNTPNQFSLLISSPGADFDGQNVALTGNTQDPRPAGFASSQPDSDSIFALNDDGELNVPFGSGRTAYLDTQSTSPLQIVFDAPAPNDADQPLLDCDLDPCTQAVTCSVDTADTFYGCEGDQSFARGIYLAEPGTLGEDPTCQVLTLKAVSLGDDG